MKSNTRTARSIRNMTAALIYFGVAIVLEFVARRVFLERLGADVLGLNSTAVNLLQFLNLAELGVGVAIGYALYGPLQHGDSRRVSEIVALQGHIYRRVGLGVLGGAVVLSAFFPLIFEGMKLPLWYAYASFGVMLYSSLLSYMVNYKNIVVSADQREYLLLSTAQVVQLVKIAAQIYTVGHMSHPYLWWLALEGAGATGKAVVAELVVRRYYPMALGCREGMRRLAAKYPDVSRNTRRIFVHRVSAYVLTQTSPLVIYGCLSLAMVAYYGNYMLICGGLLSLLTAALGGLGAGVGKLVAEGDDDRARSLFDEMLSLRFAVSACSSAALVLLLTPTVSLWLGLEYVLTATDTALIVAIYFLNSFRPLLDTFKEAYGLFADVWAALVETVLNLGLSIAGGLLWGLPGILGGVLVSLIVIVLGWKPWYIFRRGLKWRLRHFWQQSGIHAAAAIAAALVTACVARVMPVNPSASVADLLIYGISTCATFAVVLGALLVAVAPGARLLLRRLTRQISRQ